MKKKIKLDKFFFKKEALYSDSEKDDLEAASFQFLSYSIAAHALCLIFDSGILNILLTKDNFKEESIKNFNNPSLIKTALFTLMGANIVSWDNKCFYITKFGRSVAKKIGFITLPLTGYRKLLSKQAELLENPNSFKLSDIDFASIALSSIDFGSENLDPVLIEVFKQIKPKGTICDLGCGTGEKLVRICQTTNSPGLGIELSNSVIKESKKFTKKIPQIEIIKGNILSLNGIWEDVTVSMISFVLHDIKTKKECAEILHSYQNHFPRMQYLLVIDIVSPSETLTSIMPGFDYVHGLQGLTPRNYEETIETFKKAKYEILEELEIKNMPNTFIWILEPDRSR